jgi:NADPH-dependent glutamate synthase beta subunit-like oxidoreductase
VFPGILGRVCDRPCKPACRRGRVDEEPVAICRMKRVAADLKGDVSALMPPCPNTARANAWPASVLALPRSPWRAIWR